MARSREGEKVSTLADLDVVVDADAHVMENYEEIIKHVDDDKKALRDILQAAGNPLGDVFQLIRSTPNHPFKTEEGYSGSSALRGEKQESPEKKVERMKEYGIDRGLISPTLSLGITTVGNSRYAVAIAEAYNSWLAETFFDRTERLKFAIAIAPQKPERAAQEIDRWAGEDDVVAVQLPATGLSQPAGHERYDPIYDAAQRHDLAVVTHSAGTSGWKIFPNAKMQAETYAEEHAIVHPFSQQWNFTTMLYRGVPEKFPDLDIVFQEPGLAWVPYWVWRLDDHYLEYSYDVPGLDRLPSEYVKESFYFTTQPLGHTAENPGHLAQIIEMIGADSVMFSADLPHPDFDTPEELFDRIAPHLDATQVRGIMGETAAELFDLQV